VEISEKARPGRWSEVHEDVSCGPGSERDGNLGLKRSNLMKGGYNKPQVGIRFCVSYLGLMNEILVLRV
jgi:hypothetical protein